MGEILAWHLIFVRKAIPRNLPTVLLAVCQFETNARSWDTPAAASHLPRVPWLSDGQGSSKQQCLIELQSKMWKETLYKSMSSHQTVQCWLSHRTQAFLCLSRILSLACGSTRISFVFSAMQMNTDIQPPIVEYVHSEPGIPTQCHFYKSIRC